MTSAVKKLIHRSRALYLTLTVILLASTSLLYPSQESKAATRMLLQITDLKVTADLINIDYQIDNSCLIGEPSLEILNKSNFVVTKLNPPESLDEPLIALLTQEADEKCVAKEPKITLAKISFPNELSLTNLTAFKFATSINDEEDAQTKKTASVELRFIGITSSGSAPSALEPSFQLEEFWYQPGKEPIRKVLGDKNINAILGTTKDGVIVKTFTKNFEVLTWLVTTKKWELLSKKTIYIEPGTLSKDKKWLIGRKVADGLSTKVYAQNLATGSVSILFDVTKNGGGYICGGMADENQKYGYFSHIASKKTVLYRIDLSTRKVKAMGKAKAGFCVSDVMQDGRIVGLVRDESGTMLWSVLANSLLPDNAQSRRTPEIRTFEDGSSHAYATDSLIVLRDTIGMSLFITNHQKSELWEGPIKLPASVQFFNPLPSTWRNTTQRAIQPK